MVNCVFCQIVNKTKPAYLIYEDKNFLAFLDINPRVEGHTLVIPKKHYQFIYEVPNFSQYWQVALKITKAMRKAMKPYFVTYIVHGLEVPHAHIHILPRKVNETEFIPAVKYFSRVKMVEIANKIAQALKNKQ
ncbi:MAG: HIT domain-containing protein [Microgenomates group bacterium]|nr:HIT domain-containing protein [Microgenomates group bacterium]